MLRSRQVELGIGRQWLKARRRCWSDHPRDSGALIWVLVDEAAIAKRVSLCALESRVCAAPWFLESQVAPPPSAEERQMEYDSCVV